MQNIAIGFARIGMNEDELLDAILQLDDKKLPPEKLRKLLPYVPTDGELQMVRDYVKNGGNVNELSKVEQLFEKMMDLVGIRERISLWIFKLDFLVILKNVVSRIKLVHDILIKLQQSDTFKNILYIILSIGNHLNYNTSRGNAYGFHLEPTLDLLSGMKGNDKKTSLMLFVVETIKKK